MPQEEFQFHYKGKWFKVIFMRADNNRISGRVVATDAGWIFRLN